MTDRRPLGTGPATVDLTRTRDAEPAPRAQLAAERLSSVPAAEPQSGPTAAGRRSLGTGPTTPG